MTELLVALCVVFLVVMGGKAAMAWPTYKGSIYQQLFGSYLEYFWKYSVNRDLSASGYLNAELGHHRLLYNSYRDSKGHEAAQFVTVLTSRGAASLCVVRGTGAISGGDIGTWHVERDGKTSAFPSPVIYVRRQQKFLTKVLGKMPVSYAIVFDDAAALDGVTCSYSTVHKGKAVDFLRGLDGTLTDQQIDDAFEAYKRQAGIA